MTTRQIGDTEWMPTRQIASLRIQSGVDGNLMVFVCFYCSFFSVCCFIVPTVGNPNRSRCIDFHKQT